MPHKRFLLIAIACALLAGCSDKARQGLYQGIYDGCRIEEKTRTTPQERLGRPDMDYGQYQNALKERREENKR